MYSFTVFLVCIVMIWAKIECQESYESPYDPNTGLNVNSFKVNEWKRYLNFHKKNMKKILLDIKRFKKRKSLRSSSKNKKMAPNFQLSRTQDGFIVKQLEPGTESNNDGGFQFPPQPVLMTNVKYKYDGAVSPVFKLSVTDKGVVSKRLEHGFAQLPGVNWQKRSGSLKSYRKKLKINENGEIDQNKGISKRYPTGSLSIRGTLRTNNFTDNLKADEIKEIEDLPTDETYVETDQYKSGDDKFETNDKYYTYTNADYDENEDDNEDDNDTWETTADISAKSK